MVLRFTGLCTVYSVQWKLLIYRRYHVNILIEMLDAPSFYINPPDYPVPAPCERCTNRKPQNRPRDTHQPIRSRQGERGGTGNARLTSNPDINGT